MSNTQKIEMLLRRASTETDAEKLRKIAVDLRDLGAWDEMYDVERKAHNVELKQAEVN